MIKRTSDGLRDLLIRHGVTPTMDRKKDIELARQFMPKGYNMSNWISVDDRLPELDDISVIVNFDNGSIESVHTSFFENITCGLDHRGVQMYQPYYVGHDPKVTHWMPLPEPPK